MRAEIRWMALALSLLMVTVVSSSRASTVGPEAMQRVAAGDAAYESGDPTRAIEAYEQAIADGADHALVHYNLGNAYFKAGRLGAAIASYVRAQRLAPRDERIATNLQRAHEQIRDRELAASDVPTVLRPVPWLYGRLSLNEWWSVALTGWIAFVATRLLRHWTRIDAGLLRRVGLALGVVVVLASVMGGVRYRDEVLRPAAVVLPDEVEVRSGPGRDYPLAFRVHAGLQVRSAEIRDEWVRIDLGGELTGWVPAPSLERI